MLQERVVVKLTLLGGRAETDRNISNTRARTAVKDLAVLNQRQRQTSFETGVRDDSVVMRLANRLE